jgi:cell wall-associated NlpC family hydrolase
LIDVVDLISDNVKFANGGRCKKDGFDCWGLAIEVFKRAGIILPDYKIDCRDASRINAEVDNQKCRWERVSYPFPVPSLIVMKLGSIYFNHTGVYIGDGKFIHIMEKAGVNISEVSRWKQSIDGFYVPSFL